MNNDHNPPPRTVDPALAMAQAPWRWDFFHALRVLEAHHAHLPRLGTARRPADEPVRLAQKAAMTFAPASLHAVVPQVAGGVTRMVCGSSASSAPMAHCRCT